jgi:hypothetical protein
MAKYTKEGRTAQKFSELVNDLTLDLELVGIYLADLTSAVLYNRLFEVFDSAKYHKEKMYTKEWHEEQIRRLGDD